jgi:hypothetical protein
VYAPGEAFVSPILGYLICAVVFLVVGAALYHVLRVRPMREAHERAMREAERRHADRLSAVAGEQMMLREWGPLSQRTPTIRG